MRPLTIFGHALRALGGAAVLAGAALAASPGSDALRAARSWGYQLEGADADSVIRSGCDLSVIDYSSNGEASGALSPADLDRIHRSGSNKIVLAYLSIGEAEDYRFYWQSEWSSAGGRPPWLSEENPEWAGNYQIEYWQPAWQSIIFGSPQSYVDKIIEAGFDGVYLDRVDAFSFWENARPHAQRDMVDFVRAIATYAGGKKDGFAILVQNGEELLAFDDYVAVIDGVAKEDLFFGAEETGERNGKEDIAGNLAVLADVREAGLPVFLVEYLDDPASIAEVDSRAGKHGFVTTFAGRDLDRPPHCPGN